MSDLNRRPGWDRQAIMTIASRVYGGLPALFAYHGWDPGEKSLSQIVSTLVVATYGSVEAFQKAHPIELPSPIEVIGAQEPDVWLTSFYGFSPRNWGFLGFTQASMRDSFIRRSKPGALVVVYAASGGAPHERGHILGVQQVSHRIGDAREFMDPKAWNAKQSDPERSGKWNYGVQAVRAWRITPETRLKVADFAPVTFTPGRGQVIGAQGMRLDPSEARRILELDLEEVEVFGGLPIYFSTAGPASQILKPSRPGPVSSTPHMVREAEGPKHLYILRLEGNAHHFMGRDVEDLTIVKVGFSRSPDTRCNDHNRALPDCAFRWVVDRSTFLDGREAFSSSDPAIAGENAMKDWLDRYGESLGGEFFLTDPDQVERAWNKGIAAAEAKDKK